MVKAKRKPLEDIKKAVQPFAKILNIGCGGCVSVCMAGGQKEVNLLNSRLAMDFGRSKTIEGYTVERQCAPRFLSELKEIVASFDCLLSMACGAGAQLLAEMYPDIPVFPAVDTMAVGVDRDLGVYEESCRACGDCIIGYTGGICPIARCAKGLFNGPCGGIKDGMCEADHSIPCAWATVYDRLKLQGRLDCMLKVKKTVDWQNQVQRRIVQDEYV